MYGGSRDKDVDAAGMYPPRVKAVNFNNGFMRICRAHAIIIFQAARRPDNDTYLRNLLKFSFATRGFVGIAARI